VNDKLERIWKEAVVSYFKISLQLPAITEKNHENPVRIAGLRAEI
jgi:hypothetical protein